MTNQECAKIIMAQIEQGFNLNVNLGGTVHKISFFKTIGAQNLAYTENSLSFKARVGNKSRTIIIKLNSLDLYDIEFYTIRKFESKKINEINDVYNDQLTDILIRELGL